MTRLSLFERRLRITTGLILTVYLLQHLTNHSLGLISLEAMESMRRAVTPFWRSPIGAILIYGSLGVHFVLALLSLYRRTTLTMPRWELAQLLLGLSMVPLLAGHIAATWGSRVLMDFNVNYQFILNGMLSDNWIIAKQSLLLLVAWCHVVVGLHFFLRLFQGYSRWKIHLYPLVILIPLLVILSMFRMGDELGVWKTGPEADTTTPQYQIPTFENGSANPYSPEKPANQKLKESILIGFYGLLGLVLLARWIRERNKKSKSGVIIKLISGRVL